MASITIKTLRDAEWKRVYGYDGVTVAFETFSCEALPGITITYERQKQFKRKVKTIYTIRLGSGCRTDSILHAIRVYNAEAKKQADARRRVADGPQPAGAA